MSEKVDDVADAASIRTTPSVSDAASIPPEPIPSDAAIIPTENAYPDDSIIHASGSEQTEARRVGPVSYRRRRRRTNWMLVSLFAFLCLVFLFYVVVLPEIELGLFRSRNPKKKFLPPELEMKWASRTLLRSCEFLFVGWFFYFGASIGSFLNVVAWRVPEGRTIVFGGSKCPFCNTHLSFIDNTPILGWLTLQGKCRTCRLPIAPRYLLIEIAVGATFMWLAMWQLVRGSANLPNWNFPSRVGLVNIVLDPQWQSIGIYAVHAATFSVLIMLATANVGKKPFPVFPLCFIAFGLGSLKIMAPYMDLIAWHAPFSKLEIASLGLYANPILSVFLGGVSGITLGWITSFVFARNFGPIVGRHWTLQCFLVGTVLGWQSAVTIVVASLITYALVRPASQLLEPRILDWPLSNRAIGLNACFILVALTHHSLWLQIASLMGLT